MITDDSGYTSGFETTPAPQTQTLASKEELNEIARALQDLWSVVKPEPRPSPFDAVWREYAAEIRRVVLKNTPPQEHVVGRDAALEEAAKLAEDNYAATGQRIADLIRDLKSKPSPQTKAMGIE